MISKLAEIVWPVLPMRRARTRSCSTTEPIALDPLPGEQLVLTDSAVATFWPYRPSTADPGVGDVAQHSYLERAVSGGFEVQRRGR
jgi:hypothetical protein